MRRAYKFRAYPTRPQEGRSVALLRDHCDLYNAALEERREAWRMRELVGYYYSHAIRSAQGDPHRLTPKGQGRHSFTAPERTLRRLDDAFRAFYQRCQRAGRCRAIRGSSPTAGSIR